MVKVHVSWMRTYPIGIWLAVTAPIGTSIYLSGGAVQPASFSGPINWG